MKKTKFLTAAIIALLTAPAFAEDQLPATKAVVAPDREYPEPDHATRPRGVFVEAEQVLRVIPGLTKGQVYTLLDVPHFHEGLFGVRTWNYLLNFHTGGGDQYVTCQFQVHFGKHGIVDGAFWKDQKCADLVDQLAKPKVVVQQQIVAQPVAVVEPSRYELHFDFDSAQVRSGEAVTVATIADRIQATHPRSVMIVGMTDTKGSSAHNDDLAQRRAGAVADALRTDLSARGVALPQISTGASRELAVPTGAEVKEEANRRVVVTLSQ